MRFSGLKFSDEKVREVLAYAVEIEQRASRDAELITYEQLRAAAEEALIPSEYLDQAIEQLRKRGKLEERAKIFHPRDFIPVMGFINYAYRRSGSLKSDLYWLALWFYNFIPPLYLLSKT